MQYLICGVTVRDNFLRLAAKVGGIRGDYYLIDEVGFGRTYCNGVPNHMMRPLMPNYEKQPKSEQLRLKQIAVDGLG